MGGDANRISTIYYTYLLSLTFNIATTYLIKHGPRMFAKECFHRLHHKSDIYNANERKILYSHSKQDFPVKS